MKKIIVIGAGPAGFMAAIQAAKLGAEVTLLERNQTPGRKLLLTGKGRCNLTNAADLQEFIQAFGLKGRFLYGAFNTFFHPELLGFFRQLKVQTVVERGGRIFPSSQKSSTVLKALRRAALTRGVEIITDFRVTKLFVSNGAITAFGPLGQKYEAQAVVLATGGRSYPSTGSTGDGYDLARQAGHSIVQPLPSLVPLRTKESWPARLQGLSLKNVELKLIINGQEAAHRFGEMLFTHFGVSGPIVLDISRDLVEHIRQSTKDTSSIESIDSIKKRFFHENQVILVLNLKPALSQEQVLQRLQRDFDVHGKQHFATILKQLLPSSFIPEMITLTKIPRDKLAHQIKRSEKETLARNLTALPLTVTGLGSWDEAIVTSGGVALDEINPKSMESKLLKGLYFAGELLDIDACTGGYNLQAAFSTGWVAGQQAAK